MKIKSKFDHKKIVLIGVSLTLILIIAGILILLSQRVDNADFQPSPTSSATSISDAGQYLLTPSAVPTPGLVIYGTVVDQDGIGVAEVLIYRNYASYPGEVIATTDANGYYESSFYGIPGDEMVSVWAEKTGLAFELQYYRWRHYYGYERREMNFKTYLP